MGVAFVTAHVTLVMAFAAGLAPCWHVDAFAGESTLELGRDVLTVLGRGPEPGRPPRDAEPATELEGAYRSRPAVSSGIEPDPTWSLPSPPCAKLSGT